MTDRQLCGRSIHPIGFGAMPLSWSGILGLSASEVARLAATLPEGTSQYLDDMPTPPPLRA